jgi:hypothetical protein
MMIVGGFFPGLNRQEHEADQFPQSSFEARIHGASSSSPVRLHCMDFRYRQNFKRLLSIIIRHSHFKRLRTRSIKVSTDRTHKKCELQK